MTAAPGAGVRAARETGGKPVIIAENTGMIDLLWFLPTMFWASVLVRCLLSRSRHIGIHVLVLVCVFLLCQYSAKYVWLPFDIQAGGCAAIFVYIGWLLKNKLLQAIPQRLHRFSWLLFPLGSACLLYVIRNNIILNMNTCHYPFSFSCVFFAVIISGGVFWLSGQITSDLARLLAFFGRYSLCILSFHFVELECLPWASVLGVLARAGASEVSQFLAVYVLKVILCGLLTFFAIRFSFFRKVFGIHAQT